MTNDIISPENLVYKKPTLMNDTTMHYCPGCSHGVVHKLVAEVVCDLLWVVSNSAYRGVLMCKDRTCL